MPMKDYFARFAAAPGSFKKSYAMLAVAWICHPIFLFSLFHGREAVDGAGSWILKMVVVSLGLAVLLFLIKPWARALVVVGNLFVVIYDLFFFAVLAPHQKISTILCIIVVLFVITGTYWLFAKASRDYFAKLNPKAEDPKGQGA